MPIRARVLLALAGLLAFAGTAAACSCAWSGSFLDLAKPSFLTVVGRVESYGPELDHAERHYRSMKIAVREVLVGETRASTLEVFGDPGHLCRPYITPEHFAIGADYVLAIHEGDAEFGALAISGCGESWLPLRDGRVTGVITGEEAETMSLERLRELLGTP